jgi:hypothetical protein
MSDETYGWACADPDCNATDSGPYTATEADYRRRRHEMAEHLSDDDWDWLTGRGRWAQ